MEKSACAAHIVTRNIVFKNEIKLQKYVNNKKLTVLVNLYSNKNKERIWILVYLLKTVLSWSTVQGYHSSHYDIKYLEYVTDSTYNLGFGELGIHYSYDNCAQSWTSCNTKSSFQPLIISCSPYIMHIK